METEDAKGNQAMERRQNPYHLLKGLSGDLGETQPTLLHGQSSVSQVRDTDGATSETGTRADFWKFMTKPQPEVIM